MRSVGESGGSLSSDPAGITAMLKLDAILGIGLPHFVQNTVRNRSAFGTLKLDSRSSPSTQVAVSVLKIILLAWPVPLDFLQRLQ